MPKLKLKKIKQKTNRASSKRFRLLGNGDKLKCDKKCFQHSMIKRSSNKTNGREILDETNTKNILKYHNLHQTH